MIALKDDPCLVESQRLRASTPPFAFGSGMDMVDVSRVEAVELGLTGWRSEINVSPCPSATVALVIDVPSKGL